MYQGTSLMRGSETGIGKGVGEEGMTTTTATTAPTHSGTVITGMPTGVSGQYVTLGNAEGGTHHYVAAGRFGTYTSRCGKNAAVAWCSSLSPVALTLLFVVMSIALIGTGISIFHVNRVYARHYSIIKPLYWQHQSQNATCAKQPELRNTPDFKKVCDDSANFLSDTLEHMAWEKVLEEESEHFNWILEPLSHINQNPMVTTAIAVIFGTFYYYSGRNGAMPFIIQVTSAPSVGSHKLNNQATMI